MLASDEYAKIRTDYYETSRSSKYLARSYRPPKDLSFIDSLAFFPDAAFREKLEHDYNEQSAVLFSRQSYPSFDACSPASRESATCCKHEPSDEIV